VFGRDGELRNGRSNELIKRAVKKGPWTKGARKAGGGGRGFLTKGF